MGSPCIDQCEYIRHLSLRDENQELGQTRAGIRFKRGSALTLFRPTGGKHFTESPTHYTVSGEMGFLKLAESRYSENKILSQISAACSIFLLGREL